MRTDEMIEKDNKKMRDQIEKVWESLGTRRPTLKEYWDKINNE